MIILNCSSFTTTNCGVRLKSTTYALERQWEYTLHGTRGSFLQQRFDGQEAALVAGAIPTATPWLPEIKEPNGILHTLESRVLTTAQHGNYWQFTKISIKPL